MGMLLKGLHGFKGAYVGSSDVKKIYLGSDKVWPAYDAQIEYLENNSTSYIDTGYKPNHNTRIVCEMQEVSNSPYGRLFGCVGGTSYNSTPLLAVDYETNVTGNLRILMGNDTSWNIISSVTGDYNKHTYEVNKNKFYRDNTLLFTHSEVTYQCITNLAIFSYMKTDGITTGADEFMKGRVYSFKIYESDVLVRDYIPVRVGTTGYLYDKVSGQLFGNEGTGTFTLGNDIQEVEYLQSTGTQYIDTGIKLYDSTSVNHQLDIKFIGYTDSSGLGCYVNSLYEVSPYPGDVLRYSQSDASVQWTGGAGGTDFTKEYYSLNTVLELSLKVNGTYSSHTINTTIFAGYNSSGNPWRYGNMKLYYCKITKNGTLVRDYIPVRVGTTGYLYDKVSGTLFGNRGSGNFTYGPDI